MSFKMYGYGARIIKVHCKSSRKSCSGNIYIYVGVRLPGDPIR